MSSLSRVQNLLLASKSRILWALYPLLSRASECIFREQKQLKDKSINAVQLRSMISLCRGLQSLDLSLDFNYFILDASFGDKWCILSLIDQHLQTYQATRIIAVDSDRELIKTFVGRPVSDSRFIFICKDEIKKLTSFFTTASLLSMPLAAAHSGPGILSTVTSYFLANGFPAGSIRHLHIVNYPYFNELHNLHGVSYATLLKTILYLPASARPVLPSYYVETDHNLASALVHDESPPLIDQALPAIILNAVNFSQVSLLPDQFVLIIQTVLRHGYRVLLNTTQASESCRLKYLVEDWPQVSEINIPSHLVALVFNQVHAVIGVLGGGMNIAVQFSGCHVLSLQTPALWTGCSEDELLGPWGKESIWSWIDQDWPCLHPGRVVENRFIGDPASLSEEVLESTITSFLQKLPDN